MEPEELQARISTQLDRLENPTLSLTEINQVKAKIELLQSLRSE